MDTYQTPEPNDLSRRRFLCKSLAATGVVAAAALGNSSPAWAQAAPAAAASKPEDLKTAAERTYRSLKAVFEKDRNYWRLGQTFDTVIDYLLIAHLNDGEAGAFGKLALECYAASKGSWYDDYAWWAIANLRASQNKPLFGEDTAQFYTYSLDCWKRMVPASTIWEKAKTAPNLQAAKPAVEGGVWNHGYDVADNGIYNPLNPAGDCLAGYQNTVTNALYLVISARLARQAAPGDSSYREAMEREYHFLQSWFTMARPGFDPLLNVYADTKDKAVVRERVSCYDSGSKLRGYVSNLAWTGDQGLIIGGLVERMEIVKKADPSYPFMLSVVRQILAGVMEYLAVDGVLLPWWPDPAIGTCPKKPGGDPEDYRTGIAVFLRYLLHVKRLDNEDLQGAVAPYAAFVLKNAKRVIQSPSSSEGNVDAVMVNLTNDLGILTAALAFGRR